MRWWAGGSGSAGPHRGSGQVVDPTSTLLREISGVESRVPWIPLGIALLALLWLPGLAGLAMDAVRPAESAWIQEVLTGEGGATGEAGAEEGALTGRVSAFSRQLARATWEWQGAEIESVNLEPPQRLAARLPTFITGLVALFVFYFLARFVLGDAAAVLAACFLATATPWEQAGTSALPLLVGEMLVLLGVLWALALQSRHREVGVAPVNALRIGGAGVFLGIGLLLAPAAFATFATTLLVWLMLGLRRSSSSATTLPVGRGEISFFTVAGTLGLLAGTAVSMWAVERFLGQAAGGFSLLAPVTTTPQLWVDVYRRLISPGPLCDVLVVSAAAVIAIVRGIEWSAGRPWQAPGLLPWALLGLWVWAVRTNSLGSLDVPLVIPPLFVLGAGWLVLRGLRPGVVRRQEYTFLVVWVLMGSILVPFVGGELPKAQLLAASVVALPPLTLVAARGARALWEAAQDALGKLAILILAYASVMAFLVAAIDDVLPSRVPWISAAAAAFDHFLPWIVLGAAALGVLSVLLTVRPDSSADRALAQAGSDSGGRSSRGRGGHGSRGGRRRGGRGSSRGGSSSRRTGGSRSSGGLRGTGRGGTGSRGSSGSSGGGRSGRPASGGRSGGGRGPSRRGGRRRGSGG